MARLVVKSGTRAGEVLEITRELIVGRAPGADLLVTDDSELSRCHAVVRSVDDGLEVEDLGSLNGTWVDGRRISEATVLRHGSRMRMGKTEVEVDAEPLPAETRLAASAATLEDQGTRIGRLPTLPPGVKPTTPIGGPDQP